MLFRSEVAPAVADAYMTFVLHSSVAGTAFGMEESGHLEFISLEGYSRESYDALMDEFIAIENAPAAIAGTPDNMIYEDLRPWLEEFGKLGRRSRMLLESIDLFNKGDIPGFWVRYANNLMSDRDMEAYMAHPSGTVRLQPYYEKMVADLVEAFYHTHKDKVEYEHIPGEGA